ncbi:carbon-nitrogen hydrolase family protein [Sphingomonas sp. CGMCC 1.13654]|uniref:Carbon-nitrogen hydrolase family protein n=1 Tax=Sphingomonas chungangi TaxID=2683589 RepID=A0A838L1Z9_9SPHN|nr:carbon-nitrogen hydrolase family protein [Sphingomonas chungangi]MBA2933214.1 carbon-nitrogen hydrolase family protein [Sphingomonas chungangi]MVW57886.1 carbon-nitrogen hydrolase family protein [Sphingomonas chungangi]
MRVAILQMTSGIDPAANGAALVAGMEAARAGGAAMLFTPEMTGLLDRDRKRAAGSIVGEDEDRVLIAAREAAARLGLWVHLGSLALRPGGEEIRYVNRGFLIDDAGAVRARYDKLHLFDVDLPTGESWRESAAYAPGEGAVVAATPAGRLGLSICYDMRFPDLYRALSDAGAEILAAPAAFTLPTGQAHWHVLLRARAIEAGCFVIAAAQTGTHEDGRSTYGHSLVIDPWGEVLLDMGETPGVGFAEIDLAKLHDIRTRIPALKHRRPIPEVARA